MSRRTLLIAATVVAVLVIVGAAGLFVVLPPGAESAPAAAVEHVDERADAGSSKVLTQQDWGEGQLVLVGYERRGVKRLGLAFASDELRGWRVTSYTEETAEPDDVVVGSLLVASSQGGDGQPAWSAAVGQLIDDRIDRVEIKWASGDSSFAPRVSDAYLVVQKGTTTALEARYLSKEGAEIAKVPVEQVDA
jgi:hypothetical protein